MIWCAMMGYDPAAFRESTAEETASILSDLLNYLSEQGIIDAETAEMIDR